MKKIYFLFSLLFALTFAHHAHATHIVGGEFNMVRNANGTYTLSLNLYFDVVNGSKGAEDNEVYVSVFRKRDNERMGNVTLPFIGSQPVNYSSASCTISTLVTKVMQYQRVVNLPENAFNDPEGYYITWERCCRNNKIINIDKPENSGVAFYLEFPAVVKDEKPFLNSSPQFVIPKGDYICANKPFTFDFKATDPDGDQLKYSLVQPYNGHSTAAQDNSKPIEALSAPYSLVTWTNNGALNIDINNVIPGPVPLRVNSQTGELSVTANKTGLYVFSVLCEEFRNNIKIGEVRRDFQLMVIDCPTNDAPSVSLRRDNKTPMYQEKDTIVVESDGERCFEVLAVDPDFRQTLNLSVRPINFTNANLFTLSPSSGIVNGTTDSLRTKLCFTDCAETPDNQPLIFELIARDQGCPVPGGDTLLVKVVFKPKPNQEPSILTNLPDLNTAELIDTVTVIAGNTLTFNVKCDDLDGDQISVVAIGRGFALKDIGMSFINGSAKATLTTPFVWNPICDFTGEKFYTIDFIVSDSRCNQQLKDTVTVVLHFKPRSNTQPNVYTDPAFANNYIDYTIDSRQPDDSPTKTIVFDVIADDQDPQEYITLKAIGRGFDLKEVGMQFKDTAGISTVRSTFSWRPDCGLLNGKDNASYLIDFITEDNSCNVNHRDTITMTIKVNDIVEDYTFEPINVFTPNNDGKNDQFTLPDLPLDNCKGRFEYIEIYNRWGKIIYRATRRDFIWDGGNFSHAAYFYIIKYTHQRYKGTVSILRSDDVDG